MRSTATMIMVIVMISLLAFGCASNKNNTKADAAPVQETVAPAEEAPVEAPVDAPAVEAEAPAEAPVDAPADAPADAPVEAAPVDAPAEEAPAAK